MQWTRIMKYYLYLLRKNFLKLKFPKILIFCSKRWQWFGCYTKRIQRILLLLVHCIKDIAFTISNRKKVPILKVQLKWSATVDHRHSSCSLQNKYGYYQYSMLELFRIPINCDNQSQRGMAKKNSESQVLSSFQNVFFESNNNNGNFIF